MRPSPLDSPAGPAQPQVTDKTPYGLSEGFGVQAFRRTCWWVCGASAQRLTHLALIPRSSASRRFVFWTVLLLAFAMGLLQLGLFGWHRVTNAPRDETSLATMPGGRGWYHLVGAEPPPPYHGQAVPTDVWWNPTQGVLAAAGAFVAALLAAGLILSGQRAGARRALGPKYRDQGRMEAALHYGTAWLIFLPLAAALAALGPLVNLSVAGRWPMMVAPLVIYAPAVVIAIISVSGYLFGLVRSAATVPVAVRTRAVIFFAFWNPLLMAVWVGGAAAGVYFGMGLVIPRLDLGW